MGQGTTASGRGRATAAASRRSGVAPMATAPRDRMRTRAAIAARRARAIDDLPAGMGGWRTAVVAGPAHRPITRAYLALIWVVRLRCRGRPLVPASDPFRTSRRASPPTHPRTRRHRGPRQEDRPRRSAPPRPAGCPWTRAGRRGDRQQSRRAGHRHSSGGRGPAEHLRCVPPGDPPDRPAGRHPADPVAGDPDQCRMAAERPDRGRHGLVLDQRREPARSPRARVQPVRLPAATRRRVPGRAS